MINKDFSLLPIDYPSNLILDRHTLKINSNHTKLRHLQNNNRCKGMLENLVHNMRMSYLQDKRQKAQQQRRRYQLGKENFGIFIEPYQRIANDTSMEKKEDLDLRASSVHSKTFKIRFNAKNKPPKKSSLLRTLPHKPALKENISETIYHHTIPSTPKNFPSLASFAHQLHSFSQKNQRNSIKNKNWGIFIPSILLIKQHRGLREKLFILYSEGVSIYGISYNPDEADILQQTYDFVDVLYPKCNSEIQKYMFFGLNGMIPEYLLLINLKQSGPFWLPCFENRKQYVFINCEDCNFFMNFSIDYENNKVKFTSKTKNLEIGSTENNRQLYEKILFEAQRRQIRNIETQNHPDSSTPPNLEHFYCEMASYVGRRSPVLKLKSKSKIKSNQFLAQLIANNKFINKQIHKYWEETKFLQIPCMSSLERLAIEYYVL